MGAGKYENLERNKEALESLRIRYLEDKMTQRGDADSPCLSAAPGLIAARTEASRWSETNCWLIQGSLLIDN